jgi:oligosaccharyltransferase complex subunit alpha (ribophorin I)
LGHDTHVFSFYFGCAGPFASTSAFSTEELKVHFQNNYSFMTLTDVVREVEVSHWGHISFEEHIDMAHTGAKLKGTFSRLDFQRNPSGSPSHFRAIKAHLPASAHSLYYRDVIGNISSSRAHVNVPSSGEAFTKLELFPRYLLFGGWKTKFYYGWVAPLSEFLGIAQDGSYSLRVPFGTAIVGAVVDNLETRVILPEGAS